MIKLSSNEHTLSGLCIQIKTPMFESWCLLCFKYIHPSVMFSLLLSSHPLSQLAMKKKLPSKTKCRKTTFHILPIHIYCINTYINILYIQQPKLWKGEMRMWEEDDGSVYGRPSALISVSSGVGRHLRCGLRSVAPVGGAAIVGLVDLGLLLHGAGLASLAWATLREQNTQLTSVKSCHFGKFCVCIHINSIIIRQWSCVHCD